MKAKVTTVFSLAVIVVQAVILWAGPGDKVSLKLYYDGQVMKSRDKEAAVGIAATKKWQAAFKGWKTKSQGKANIVIKEIDVTDPKNSNDPGVQQFKDSGLPVVELRVGEGGVARPPFTGYKKEDRDAIEKEIRSALAPAPKPGGSEEGINGGTPAQGVDTMLRDALGVLFLIAGIALWYRRPSYSCD